MSEFWLGFPLGMMVVGIWWAMSVAFKRTVICLIALVYGLMVVRMGWAEPTAALALSSLLTALYVAINARKK